jgi:hypothetical protein
MENPQTELFTAVTTWFHVLNDMIDGGDMAKLDGSAVKVYLVVKSHTNFATGRAFPSLELIQEKAGLSKSQAIRSLASLEEFGYITKEKSGRHNVYTLREKVSIRDEEGRPQAVATWDYIPHRVKEAIAELKHATVSGELMGGKIIHIETLNLNVNIFNGENANQTVNNLIAGDLDKLPPDMRKSLEAIRDKAKIKRK